MPTIAAANNLNIRAEDNTWSLFNGRTDDLSPIVQARPDGLSYRPAFATARHLSPDGSLPADQISMVVVGWAVEDSSWHLGLMFTPEVAQTRGGRWCGLARWSNADGDSAAQAGQWLAQTLGKPFKLVPPPEGSQPAPQAQSEPIAQLIAQPAAQMSGSQALSQPIAPTIPSAPQPAAPPRTPMFERARPTLLPLPITVGEWTLNGDEDMLVWQRSRSWRNKTLLNAFFFVILTLVFGALSLGARMSVFAPVQPDWLPIVGIGLTALMILLIIGQLLSLFRATSIIVDNHERFVRVVRGYRPGRSAKARVLVQSPYEGIEYVLISHVLSRREEHQPGPVESNLPTYDRIWPEVWIHLYSPRRGFINVCYISQAEGRMRSGLTFPARRELDLREIDTPAHHAALHMSQMMRVPAYVENR